MISLANKAILITGASRGLGAVCGQTFSSLGARLVLMARSGDLLAAVRASCTDPERHLAIAVDLADLAAIPSALARAQEFLGGLDAVLHVAGGGLGLREPLLPAAARRPVGRSPEYLPAAPSSSE